MQRRRRRLLLLRQQPPLGHGSPRRWAPLSSASPLFLRRDRDSSVRRPRPALLLGPERGASPPAAARPLSLTGVPGTGLGAAGADSASMMKFKPNQTRTYDREGFKKRAACLCFRSEREDEVSSAGWRAWSAGGAAPPTPPHPTRRTLCCPRARRGPDPFVCGGGSAEGTGLVVAPWRAWTVPALSRPAVADGEQRRRLGVTRALPSLRSAWGGRGAWRDGRVSPDPPAGCCGCPRELNCRGPKTWGGAKATATRQVGSACRPGSRRSQACLEHCASLVLCR